jgi:hypothetical protein
MARTPGENDMFYVKHTDGECDPMVRCHVCASRIVDISRAMVVYPRTLDEGETSRVVMVHREACLPKAMTLLENDIGEPHSISLESFFSRLRTAGTVDC